MSLARRTYICPQCRERSGVDIIYGYPGFELVEQEERGEIVIGGCVIDAAAPDRHCRSCQHEWQIKRRRHRGQLSPFDDCEMAEQPAG
eukprot:gene17700-17914_t